MSHSVLFLGGPLDGRRQQFDELEPVHYAAPLPPRFNWAPGALAMLESYDRTPARYVLCPFQHGERVLHAYVYEGVDPLGQLFVGYRQEIQP